MDEQIINHDLNKKADIPLMIDPGKELFEEFDFKPINKGLGFHQQQKDLINAGRVKNSFQKSLAVKSANIYKTPINNEISKMDLHQVYKVEETPKKIITDTPKIESRNEDKLECLEIATSPARFLAYAIDVFFIGLLYGIMGSSVLLVSKLDFNTLVDSLGVDVFWITFGFTFSIAYLFYFSILDINATVGKAIFGIRITSENGDRLDLKTTFVRSLITLFSFLLLGLPSIMNFQSQLTATKVVKNGKNV